MSVIYITKMLKKTKKIFVRRKIREVIEIQKKARIIAYCENCQDEKIFSVIDGIEINFSPEEKETNKSKNLEKGK